MARSPTLYRTAPAALLRDSLAVGDLNGGTPDLVVGNYGSGTVAVLLNNGNGTFATAATYGAGGANPRGVAVADINGDGSPDVVVANNDNGTVGVLLNNGNGTFAAATTFSTGSGAAGPFGVTVGDFNGDGKPDVAVTNASSSSVAVLLNTDSPSSGSLTAKALSPPAATESAAFSDAILFHFTDSNSSATAADYSALITWGDGTFSAVAGVPAPTGRSSPTPTADSMSSVRISTRSNSQRDFQRAGEPQGRGLCRRQPDQLQRRRRAAAADRRLRPFPWASSHHRSADGRGHIHRSRRGPGGGQLLGFDQLGRRHGGLARHDLAGQRRLHRRGRPYVRDVEQPVCGRCEHRPQLHGGGHGDRRGEHCRHGYGDLKSDGKLAGDLQRRYGRHRGGRQPDGNQRSHA